MKKKKIAIVFGTRPEAIKMAPLILELKKNEDTFQPVVIVTAQHREMLDQVLKVFGIEPDWDLNIMKREQTLSDITASVLKGMEEVYVKEQPDLVLVHGDTTTSFAAALAAYYQQVPIAHIEAGLRTNDIFFPFPEEANRQMIDSLSDLYFVPTKTAADNLLKETKKGKKIYVTGNTVIDAVHYTKKTKVQHYVLELMDTRPEQHWVLLTMHRRESYGTPMNNVFQAILDLVTAYPQIEILMPVHLNPSVQVLAKAILGDHERVHLVDPLEVDVFHKVINKSKIVLTDSGGLQEEAPALDVPVLVLRDKTERPEGVEAGTLKLVGTNRQKVFSSVSRLLENESEYNEMAKAKNPYGDGTASKRIVEAIKKYFG